MREDLELRTAEFEAAQARLKEVEQKLRLIHQSRTYGLAKRVWRIRSTIRALFSRWRPKISREVLRTAEVELEARMPAQDRAVAPDAAPQPTDRAEVTEQPDFNGGGSGIEHAESAEHLLYYGSRGVRAADQESAGTLQPVLLFGGLTEPELADALNALALDEEADGEPLVITDCDALRTLDSAGYLYEYIPPREDWERHLRRDGNDYDRFVRRRLASIVGMYGLAGAPSID